jgi:hypothetical protein
MRYPETNEEAAKLALSVLMQGESVVLLDNVDRPLEGDWLCIILTEEKYSGRVLGSLEIIEVPTNVTWLSTGNQLVISGDLRTRTLMCRIDPQMERPAERTFRGRSARLDSEEPPEARAGRAHDHARVGGEPAQALEDRRARHHAVGSVQALVEHGAGAADVARHAGPVREPALPREGRPEAHDAGAAAAAMGQALPGEQEKGDRGDRRLQ